MLPKGTAVNPVYTALDTADWDNRIVRLLRRLYGLKSAPQIWNKMLNGIIHFKLKRAASDYVLYAPWHRVNFPAPLNIMITQIPQNDTKPFSLFVGVSTLARKWLAKMTQIAVWAKMANKMTPKAWFSIILKLPIYGAI